MNRSTTHLSLDVYDFWGYRIGIRSNSDEILAHFRSVYGRFYCNGQTPVKGLEGQTRETATCIIDAIDNIASDQILSLSDGKEFFSLRCKSLREFDQAYYGKSSIPDPIAFITYLFLKNKYRMIQGYQLFHAAAVSYNGRAVVLPAPEGMGKTTLTVQMVKAGFKFLSDEVACMDPERQMVRPYPRKLNINASSCALLKLPEYPEQYLRRSGTYEKEWAIDIEQIVPRSLSPACPLAHIIFLRGLGETPRLEPVSPSNALFRLFKYSFNPEPDPASLLFKFAPMMEGVTCHNLVSAGLMETARLVVELTDGRAAR
ncbi:MAG: hypothetical protein ACOWYE_05875 [Desulfatiglandales bacterium]